MAEALEIEKLYVRRGSFLLQDVNLSVEENCLYAAAGKSGVGKSTLIQAIGGAVAPAAGRIRYWGREMYEDETSIRREMSVVYDQPNFNTEMKPEKLIHEIRKFEPWFDEETCAVYMQQLELNPKLRVKLYSESMQRRFMLVLALCRNPKFLVMDEITSGVSRASREVMWDIIDTYRKEHALTILFTTHHDEEIARADHVLHLTREEQR